METFNPLLFIDKETWTILSKAEKAILLEYSVILSKIKKSLGDKYVKYAINNILTYNNFNKYNRLELFEKELIDNIKILHKKNKKIIDNTLKELYALNYYSIYYISEKFTSKSLKLKKLKKELLNLLIQNKYFKMEDTMLKHAQNLSYSTKNIIYQNLIQGKSYQEIARAIKHEFEKGYNSALLVSWTEGHRVMSEARQNSMSDLSNSLDMKKMWVSTIDSHTRPEHRNADTQIVEVQKPFIVGGLKGMYPGDPSLGIKNNARCRCTQISVFNNLEYTNRKNNETKEYMNMKSYNEWLKSKI